MTIHSGRKQILAALFLCCTCLLSGCSEKKSGSVQEENLNKYTNTDFAMGTVISQTVYSYGEDPTFSCVEKLNELENHMISWRVEGSEIEQVNKSAGKKEGIEISETLAGYLKQTFLLSQKSEGKLDLTVGDLSRLWNIDGEDGKEEIPEEKNITGLLKNIGYEKIKQEGNKIWVPENISLDLGAVGKGIGCDEVYQILAQDKDIQGAVISVGGSIFTYGEKTDGSLWNVGIVNPRSEEGDLLGTLLVEGGKFISTSGDYEKYFMKDGKRYHHILDPDTGYPAESGLISVTVQCDSGLLSDGLSTACFILGKEKGLKLLKEYGAEGILVDEDKNIILTEGLKEQFHLEDHQYTLQGGENEK